MLCGPGPIVVVQNRVPAFVTVLTTPNGDVGPAKRNQFAALDLNDIDGNPLVDR